MLIVVFLVVCVAVALGTLLYLFYWNRIVGSLLGSLVRLGLWTQDSSAVWVDFGSAHISLISGRVLLRDVRYHSSNQSFKIVKFQISWRWWIRNVAEEEDLVDGHSDDVESISDRKHDARCRIHASVEGFEWFMYNRTASFDDILSELSASNSEIGRFRTISRESNTHSAAQSVLVDDGKRSRASAYAAWRRALFALRFPSFLDNLSSWLTRQLPDLDPKNLLPISFEVSKGAITMGNHTTENIFMAQFGQATGTYGIVQSRSKLDLHKQLLRITFKEASISCVENRDHWASNNDIGKKVNECFLKLDPIFNVKTHPLAYGDFKKLWTRCRKYFAFFKSHGKIYSNPDSSTKRKEKGRKVHEDMSHVGAEFTLLEYAIDRKLLETPTLELLYYADVAGVVPVAPIMDMRRYASTDPRRASRIELLDIGNGDLPPEWGVDVVVHGGTIHYGPWADRQRAQLQRVLFPQTFQTTEPTTILSPGAQRACTYLKLFFEFRGVTNVHIPFREASKNWQWDGLVDVPRTRKQREAASIHMRVGDKSSVKYLVPMATTKDEYSAELDVHMQTISVTSSLNDIRLLEAESCSILSNLPSPLRWNRERTWDFDFSLDHPVIYVIRDHVNMFTDLGKDWSSGPPSDFNTFVPIIYNLNLALHNFELSLYGNDHNIIDRPLDRRENVLFTFNGDLLRNVTSLPSNIFRPLFSKASFSIEAPDVTLRLTLPRWNTHGLAEPSIERLTDIGRFGFFRLDGSYMYHAEVRKDLVDQLKLNIETPSASLKVFGWIVRHVMALRENYFGGFTQYSTTREYLGKRSSRLMVGDPLDLKYRPGKSNVFHLDLSLLARNGTLALPAGAVGFERAQHGISFGIDIGSCAVLVVPDLQVQLRLHDFFMEMSLNIDPIVVSIVDSCPDKTLLSHTFMPSKKQMSISGIQITANRLFGPQPHTSTYVCIWNISCGSIKGSLSTTEAQILMAVGKSFGHGFVDPFNAPATEFIIPSDRDATFLKIFVDEIDLSWRNVPTAVRLWLARGLSLAFNNIPGVGHRKLTNFAVPIIDLQMLLAPGSTKYWLEAGRIRTGVAIDLYSAPKGWLDDADNQRSFLQMQDVQTNRLASIIEQNRRSNFSNWSNDLYMQAVCSPHTSSLSKKKQSSQSAMPPSGARRPAKYAFIESESEDDHVISEAARDENLAKSRPTSSALPFDEKEDGHSTSAFDESDETDDHGSDNSWSDYFELGTDNDETDFRMPYLAFCRKLQLRQPSTVLDCSSKFIVRNNSPRVQMHLFSQTPSPMRAPESSNTAGHPCLKPMDTESRKFIRINLSDTGIFLTPLCVTSTKEILDQHLSDERTPELRLDDMMLKRIAATTEAFISTYDARLSSVKLCVVHEVAELLKFSSEKPQSDDNRVFAIINICTEGIRCLANVSPSSGLASKDMPSLSGKMFLRSTVGSLGTLHTFRIPAKRDEHIPLPAFQFIVSDVSTAFTKARFQLTYSTSDLQLFETAPEVLLAATNALQLSLNGLRAARNNYVSLAKLRQRHLVCSILTQSAGVISKDLLSSVQPAFFVQYGRPNRLRSDNSWKLLFHLRQSLSGISVEDYETLKQKLNATWTDTDMERALHDRRVPWTLDEGIPLVRVGLIESLFDKKVEESSISVKRHDSRAIKTFGFQATSTCLTLPGGNESDRSSLTIHGLDLRSDLLTRRMVFEAHSLSPHSSTIRSFKPTSEYVDYGSITTMLALDIDSMQVTIFPGIIKALQHAIHAWRIFSPSDGIHPTSDANGTPESSSSPNTFFDNRVIAVDVRVVVHRMLVEAAAENIVFEIASHRFSSCSVGHVTKPLQEQTLDLSVNHTLGFQEFSMKARTRSVVDKESSSLANFTVLEGVLYLLFQNHTPDGSYLRGTLCVGAMELNVPRSAIRLYKFIEQWRQDYLLGIDSMVKSLFTEIRRTPERPVKSPSSKKRNLGVNINASISKASVVLQVMHGTWLDWTTHKIMGYLGDKPRTNGVARACGLQIASQIIQISSTSSDWSTRRVPKIALDLPAIGASITFDQERINCLISVGFLRVTVKPAHWDSLLYVQQKFGQDFNDLLLILSTNDSKSKRPQTSGQKLPSTKAVLPFYVTARFEGFKIGLEGLSSTQFLECVDIDAMLSNKGTPRWRVTLSDLALYLSPRSLAKQKHAHLDRSQLPVLVSVDLQVLDRPSMQDRLQNLVVDVTKCHAILQAHLMGDIGDFVDHLQTELMLRKEQRTAELKDFKEKALKVMSTFNLNPRKASRAKQEKFLDNSLISISMANFGAAFPLDLERKLVPQTGIDNEFTTKALLLSINSLKFETQRGESGEALVEGFCFQFVSRFNPSNPEDFSAGRHHTLNQILYPEMTARMRTETSSSERHIFASSSISGFILDLDPSITSYAFSLVDVYRNGRRHMEQLAVPRSAVEASSPATPREPEKKKGKKYTITSHVEASLEFKSGTVRMHSTSKDSSAFSSISPDWYGKTYQILDSEAELFKLPELSVSAEYRAHVVQVGFSSENFPRSPALVLRGTVHSSRNALRPIVLNFVSGVVHNIEERMKQEAHVPIPSSSSIRHSFSSLTIEQSDAATFKSEEPVSSTFQLFISLRIDKSRLELTCRPDVNVIAGINWDSGGFLVSMGPGVNGVSISASIEGLTVGLKHGFLSDDSALIKAKNLIFSVKFSTYSFSSGPLINSISVVADTEFHGGLRFSRFQDLLCFKAVWLDHIPIFKGDSAENTIPPSRLSAVSSIDQAPKQGFDTSIIIRIRHIKLEADLGQSISTIAFDLETALIRTRLTSECSEVSISFARVDMQARGNLSGHLRMPDFVFRTVRRQHIAGSEKHPLSRMLELHLTSGTLDIQLQSDWLWLLQYRAEPLEAKIYDDWSLNSEGPKDRQLHLYFSVSGSKVIAMMTIMAIPKLLVYAGKIISSIEAQREGASRESSAFRSTRLPKPDNALSEVANAMFRSARSKLKETESLSYVINQHMKLQLSELIFVVLPRSQGDNELARFIGRNVTAQLQRTVQQISLPAHRDLRLSLSHMSISKLQKPGFDPRQPGQEFDLLTSSGRNFTGSENVIFSLPAMDMRMVTDERIEGGSRILPYDFVSNFVRREGLKEENIHISFNIRLYSWLTILRKTLTRELKRTQEGADWRSTNVSPQSSVAPKFTSPDLASSPFTYGSDGSHSPPDSHPSSRHSSRPASPVRSKPEPAIVTTPGRGTSFQHIMMTPLYSPPEPSNATAGPDPSQSPPTSGETLDSPAKKPQEMLYVARSRMIERLTVKQLGEATPDVMHPFFTKKAGFNLEESLPQYVHEYATVPIEEIMKGLVKLYSKQLN